MGDRTPFEYEFPGLEQMFEYWTQEGEPEMFTVLGCFRALSVLIRDFAEGEIGVKVDIQQLFSVLEAAEASARSCRKELAERIQSWEDLNREEMERVDRENAEYMNETEEDC